MVRREAIQGCLLGAAVGDALGLPYEGLSPRRAARLLGPPSRYRLLAGWGMVSDDAEHTVMVAESLIDSAGDVAAFECALAKRLRRWFWTLPAGVGMATAKACTKLTVGVSPKRSGVYSAGNGPAMRTAMLGVFSQSDPQLASLVHANTRITHTDPKAEMGALAIAVAAQCAASGVSAPDDYLGRLKRHVIVTDSEEFVTRMERAVAHAKQGGATAELAVEFGLERGVGGYVLDCVPVVVHCWLKNQHDFRAAIETVIACGGDADTNAAMLGGILGAGLGPDAIPREWRERLLLFPMSLRQFDRLANQLVDTINSGKPRKTTSPWWIAHLVRNLAFLLVVLLHGLRRVAPPY